MTETMARRTSDELIERWIRGDREAGRDLYDLYFKRAWKFGLAITRQEVEADDLAHEAIAHGLDIVRDPDKRPEKFTGWLLGAVKYLAWSRARKRDQPLPPELTLEDTRHGRPPGVMIDAEMNGVLKRALHTLSGEDRALVRERFVRGLTRPELAEKFDCSIDTIDRRLRISVERLRAHLSGHFTTLVLAGDTPSMEQVLKLRPSFRAAFLARHVQGLTMEKASIKLGIPVETLGERLRFAYETLRCSEHTDFAALRRPI